ncbi:ImmA/IrrE family metallo-endopeptidase [Pseudomonas sp. SWRI154]|nr:ImmA/IrrE family metallo-endopeptidase [Pseudomonas sp. SWRI154]
MTTLYSNGNLRSPSGLRVSPHSYGSLEEVALGVRKVLPTLQGETYSLDCCRILEHTLPQAGFNYRIEEVAELDECAAFTIPDQGLVVVREDIYELLQKGNVFGRSTVIHEMAHIVLKHAAKLHRGAQLKKHQFYEDSEWQAKALTAAIMMPLEACKEAESAEHLAKICGTSVQSARFRIDRLVKEGKITGQRSLFI